MALNLFGRSDTNRSSAAVLAEGRFTPSPQPKLSGDPLKRALQLGRFGHIVLNPGPYRDHPDFKKSYDQAQEAVDEHFALVPEGFVSIAKSTFDQPGGPEEDHDTDAFLLARFATSNAEYQRPCTVATSFSLLDPVYPLALQT